MRPKFDPSKSLVPRPAYLSQATVPVPATERRYSYLVVKLPSDVTNPDVFEALEGGDLAVIEQVLADRQMLACLEAAERSRTWCVPAWWNAIYDDGHKIIVRRIYQRTR